MRFVQVDVFTERTGGGNPLGVVLDGEHLSSEQMQAIAEWTQLVETTFLLPPSSAAASYRLRIFTPSKEIAFAGHPSVGSAHVALETGMVQAVEGRLVQECLSGNLPILVDGTGPARRLYVQSPPARVLEADLTRVRLILQGLELGALSVALVEGGRRWWLAECASESAMRAWTSPFEAIKALALASDSLGLCLFARSADAQFDLAVRAFPCGVGIIEDPASGAANGLIGAYIASREPSGALAHGYRVSQGREIGRDARIDVRIDANGVWVGGQTHTVISGTMVW